MAAFLRKISWFIPATYFLIVLVPLVLISLLGISFLIDINEHEKQLIEKRFLSSYQRVVKNKVDSITAEIDKIRDQTRSAFEGSAREYLGITMNVMRVEYQDNYKLKSLATRRKHALDTIVPIVATGDFQSIFILDNNGATLFTDTVNSENGIDLDPKCLQSAMNQPEQSVICNVTTDDKTRYRFFIQEFKPLGLLVAIGLSELEIEKSAKQKALALISTTKYGESGDEYLFAFKTDGVFLSHPASKYVGTNMIGFTDPNGVKIYGEMIKKTRQGGGFVTYVWDRYKTGKVVDKVSYAKGYPDWQWVIATGFYLDTLFETQSMQDEMLSDALKQSAKYGFLIMLVLFLFTGWLAWLIYRGFNRELSHFSKFFARNADDAVPIDTGQLFFHELKQLAHSANAMLDARHKAEQQLTTVFDTVDDLIYVADPETYELLFINKTFERQFGKNTLGQLCHKILQGKDAPCEFCTNSKIFGNNIGTVYNWEFLNTIDKQWYGITDRAIQWHDGRMVRFEHARNITEQKLAEIERKNYQERLELAVDQRTHEIKLKTDQLEQANRDLEGFSYSVSHDLRSPLRAIDGFLSIIREDYQNKLDDEGLRMFGIVQDNARKMGELIDDILAFSRAGRLELEKQYIDVNKLVKAVWCDVRNQNSDSNIEFQCRDLPPVEADKNALRQIFFNLISNAVKFSARSNPIIIEVKGEVIDEYVRYSVKDNGVGFSEEYKDKLFVMFQRLHGMDEFDGTGVGLAIIKRFVQKHGGKVDAYSTPNEGATFSFELPNSE